MQYWLVPKPQAKGVSYNTTTRPVDVRHPKGRYILLCCKGNRHSLPRLLCMVFPGQQLVPQALVSVVQDTPDGLGHQAANHAETSPMITGS
jgi:hypothetical protein